MKSYLKNEKGEFMTESLISEAEIKEIHNDEVIVEVTPISRKAKHKQHEVVTEE